MKITIIAFISIFFMIPNYAFSCPDSEITLSEPMKSIGSSMKTIARRSNFDLEEVLIAARNIQKQSSAILCAVPSIVEEQENETQASLLLIKYKQLILSLALEAVSLENFLIKKDESSINGSFRKLIKIQKEGHSYFRNRN